MAFVKLDVGILDSTLWMARDLREVFITALLMAEPQEFDEPIHQIAVDSMQETGFVAPAGWYGYVRAAGPGIVRRSGVEHEMGMGALRSLGEPDGESRSKRFDGRRLIRTDGGYVVLNFMNYRDKDHSGAERAKRYRERQKESSRCDVTVKVRDVTQSEAEFRLQKHKEELGTPLPPKGGEVRKPRVVSTFDSSTVEGVNHVAWAAWVHYRASIGKSLKPVSQERAARKLAEFGERQQACVDQSIANGWTGLFDTTRAAAAQPVVVQSWRPTED
jgi:hypothetical protein